MLYFSDCDTNVVSCKKALSIVANGDCCQARIGHHIAYIAKKDNNFSFSVVYKGEIYTYFADTVKEIFRCAINYIITEYEKTN